MAAYVAFARIYRALTAGAPEGSDARLTIDAALGDVAAERQQAETKLALLAQFGEVR